MTRTSPNRTLAAARRLVGVSAAALVLAAPLAHADEATSSTAPAEVRGASEVRTHAEAGGSSPKQSGLIPGVLFGPRLTVAVPTPTFGVEVKILRFVGASFDYGFFPKLTISGVDVSYSMWNVAARVYPFGDVFFVGAVYGPYGVEATTTVAQGTGSVRARIHIHTPHISSPCNHPSLNYHGIHFASAIPQR